MRRVGQQRVREVPQVSKPWRRLGIAQISRSLVEEGKSKQDGGLRRESLGRQNGLLRGKSGLEAPTV
jgi:hypothetical protein